MIIGGVTGLQPEVDVLFVTGGGPLAIRFVVDTGFTGALTIPAAAVSAMGLPFLQEIPANLADGSEVGVEVYVAVISWNGMEQEVAVLAMGTRPLLGTALLDGYRLSVDFTEGGLVQLDAIGQPETG